MAKKINFSSTVDADEAIGAEAKGGQFYDGPPPPKGSYTGILKRLRVTETGPQSKNPGTPMLNGLVELKAKNPKSSAAEYDGAGIWFNQQINDQGKGYVNQFLNSLVPDSDAARKKIQTAFWRDGVVCDDEGHVQRVGKALKIGSPEGSLEVAFTTKVGKNYKTGEPEAQLVSWLIKKASESDDDDDIDEDELDEDIDEDEDEDDIDEDDFDEDEDDEDDDDDDDDDDDEDEDEDEEEDDEDDEPEPTPAPKKSKKRGKDMF